MDSVHFVKNIYVFLLKTKDCRHQSYFIAGRFYKALPYILMGCLALVGAFLCLILPETFGKNLPETIPQIQPISR